MSNVLTVELDDVLASKLDALARALGRPKSWLIEQALINYVEEQSWEVEAVARSLGRYRASSATLHTHDAVMERIETKFNVA